MSKQKFHPIGNRRLSFRAFTLIELLVVIAIIGLLSSIVLVSLRGARGKASIAGGLQFSQNIFNALGDEAVGIWEFDESAGSTTFIDVSGNSNNGTCDSVLDYCPIAGITNTSSGKGYALSFDGTNDYIKAGPVNQLNGVKNITLSLWVYPNSLASSWKCVFQRGTTSWSASIIILYIDNANKKPFLHICNSSDGLNRYFYSEAIDTGNWYHIVATVDGTKVAFFYKRQGFRVI